ncbi:alpha/beta fold hydrolase [Arthrobacter sp. NPDC055585]
MTVPQQALPGTRFAAAPDGTALAWSSAGSGEPAANGERLAQLIPGAVLRILDGSRHGYFLERPDATDAVLDFLAAHPL